MGVPDAVLDWDAEGGGDNVDVGDRLALCDIVAMLVVADDVWVEEARADEEPLPDAVAVRFDERLAELVCEAVSPVKVAVGLPDADAPLEAVTAAEAEGLTDSEPEADDEPLAATDEVELALGLLMPEAVDDREAVADLDADADCEVVAYAVGVDDSVALAVAEGVPEEVPGEAVLEPLIVPVPL